MNLRLLMALMLVIPGLATPAVGEAAEQNNDRIEVDFQPDPRLVLDNGGVAQISNLLGTGEDRPPLEVESWPEDIRDSAAYSGPLLASSQFELDYPGIEKTGTVPYSYIALASHMRWNASTILNGPTQTVVRLPLYGADTFDFLSFSIWETTDPDNTTLNVDATENGTRPNITNAQRIYENYLVSDWWVEPGLHAHSYYFPDEFHQWPWRSDPVPGVYTNCQWGPPCWGPYPYAHFNTPGTYDFETLGNYHYATVNLFIEPDVDYVFAFSGILANNSKATLLLTEENVNGPDQNFTLVQGLMDPDHKTWETSATIALDAAWSLAFLGGQGAGMTGVEVDAEFNQTVELMVHMEPADGTTDFFSFALPLITDAEDWSYGIEIRAFNKTGHQLDWVDPTGTYNSDSMIIGGFQGAQLPGVADDLKATDFILYTATCLSITPATTFNCVPEMGAEYYFVKITLNPYWSDLYGKEGPHEYRLLGHDGGGSFLISQSVITTSWTTHRNGGSYYAFNLSYSAQYTTGVWQLFSPDTDTAPEQGDLNHSTRIVGHHGLTQTTSTAEGTAAVVNYLELFDTEWGQYDPTNPLTWGHLATAIKYLVMDVVQSLWNGMTALFGTLQGAFSATAEYLSGFGEWVSLTLIEIKEFLYDLTVLIFDHLDRALDDLAIAVPALFFIFFVRVIFAIASVLHLAIDRGRFE